MLRDDARAIWDAGVAAVDSERLVREALTIRGDQLWIQNRSVVLGKTGRIVVVGGGKAGAGMAAGVEAALPVKWLDRVTGLVNVPADCVRDLQRIRLHAARPAGVNEPTSEGVAGVEEMLRLVGELGPDDLCLVLLSGGGSALLPGPAAPTTLADKQLVTRALAAAGAAIQDLNTVRKHLSTIKGGRLAAASRAGQTIGLIISDVIRDPLDMIASGPTVADTTNPGQALAILERFLDPAEIPPTVRARLEAGETPPLVPDTVWNVVVGNNEMAVSAAAAKARELGYRVKIAGSHNAGEAREWGRTLAEAALDARQHQNREFCIIAGGETTVTLRKTSKKRLGGRNQEVALAAIERLWNEPAEGIVVLSGGTDGEDGPTNAAGALADSDVIRRARHGRLDPPAHLAINDSYHFFETTGGLIKTGPTNTNVMDLQVVVVEPKTKRQWVPRQQWEQLLAEETPAPRERSGRKGPSKSGRRPPKSSPGRSRPKREGPRGD